MHISINWPVVRTVAYATPAIAGYAVGGGKGFLLAAMLYGALWVLAPMFRRFTRQ